MNFLLSAVYVLMASLLASAASVPEASTDVVEYHPVNEADTTLATLDKRLDCRRFGQVLRTLGSTHAVYDVDPEPANMWPGKIADLLSSDQSVTFITFGPDLAETICHLVRGEECEWWGRLVRVALYMIYSISTNSNGAIPANAPPVGPPPGAAPDLAEDPLTKIDIDYASVVKWWEDALTDSWISFDSIDPEPFDASEAALSRRSGDPRLLVRIRFTGLLDDDTGLKYDFIANHFEGNNTVLHILGGTQENVADGAGGNAGPAERFEPPGLKISYTTNVQSQLSPSDQREMAGYLAYSWYTHADADHMSDFIGLSKTDHDANFYFRVIPEPGGFDLNYEPVDVCGAMDDFL